MGRGYSASRSKSNRPTLRTKRERSTSIHDLRRELDTAKKMAATAQNEEGTTPANTPAAAGVTLRKIKRVVRPSATPTASSKTSRAASRVQDERAQSKAKTTSQSKASRLRSMSLRGRIETVEEQLEQDDMIEASEDECNTIHSQDVMTKYKMAGRIVDEVLEVLTAACVAGANTKALCDQGDLEALSRLKAVFSKAKDEEGKRIVKGLAYPTNVSVNEVLCNHSPYHAEDAVKLKAHDIVKLHIGCHIDGYPVSAARTIVVPAVATSSSATTSSTSDAASVANPKMRVEACNAVEAARVALEGMIHMLRPGTLNADITDFIARVGAHYNVEAVEGVLSNRTKRYVPDGMQCIIGRRVNLTSPQQDVEDCEIGAFQIWSLDIAFTDTDSFRMMTHADHPTLMRRGPEEYRLDPRVQVANTALKDVTNKFLCFPFHFKHLPEPLKAKMGLNVLCKKGVVDQLPALRTKGGRGITARFSATVAITGKRIAVLCGAPSDIPVASTVAALPEELHPLPMPEEAVDVINRSLDFATAASKKTAGPAHEPARKRQRQEDVTVGDEEAN